MINPAAVTTRNICSVSYPWLPNHVLEIHVVKSREMCLSNRLLWQFRKLTSPSFPCPESVNKYHRFCAAETAKSVPRLQAAPKFRYQRVQLCPSLQNISIRLVESLQYSKIATWFVEMFQLNCEAQKIEFQNIYVIYFWMTWTTGVYKASGHSLVILWNLSNRFIIPFDFSSAMRYNSL